MHLVQVDLEGKFYEFEVCLLRLSEMKHRVDTLVVTEERDSVPAAPGSLQPVAPAQPDI